MKRAFLILLAAVAALVSTAHGKSPAPGSSSPERKIDASRQVTPAQTREYRGIGRQYGVIEFEQRRFARSQSRNVVIAKFQIICEGFEFCR